MLFEWRTKATLFSVLSSLLFYGYSKILSRLKLGMKPQLDSLYKKSTSLQLRLLIIMRSLIFEHQSLTNAISHPLIYPISSKGQFLTPRMALCVKLPTTLTQSIHKHEEWKTQERKKTLRTGKSCKKRPKIIFNIASGLNVFFMFRQSCSVTLVKRNGCGRFWNNPKPEPEYSGPFE